MDSDALLCVAKDNNNLGKVVRKVPENHGQPPNICICTALMMRKIRRIMADRIHPHGNVCIYNGKGGLLVQSNKLYEGTSISQQQQDCMTASIHFLHQQPLHLLEGLASSGAKNTLIKSCSFTLWFYDVYRWKFWPDNGARGKVEVNTIIMVHFPGILIPNVLRQMHGHTELPVLSSSGNTDRQTDHTENRRTKSCFTA